MEAGEMVKTKRERRKHRRLPVKLSVLYQAMDSPGGSPRRGDTLNVSTGGLLMETCDERCSVKAGHLLKIDLQVRPTNGLFEMAGRISGIARIVRVLDELPGSQASAQSDRSRIALQFCQRPVFDM